jgi:uncharacterized repeat protein (TIGR01451 family)
MSKQELCSALLATLTNPKGGRKKTQRISLLLTLALVLMLIVSLPVIAQGPGDWTEYTGNPIFGQGVDNGPKAYYPSVLYDPDEFSGHGVAAKYKMWYGTSSSQTALATSDDGINWTDQGVVMTDGYHATVEYYPGGFTGANTGGTPSSDTMYYRMWYWDYGTTYDVSAIGYTESPDGVNWYNHQSCQNGTVPIVTGGSADWNKGSYGPCDVLYNPSASNTGTDWTFTMYYDGTSGGDESIGLGFSSDGITWTGYDADSDGEADPVFEGTGNDGNWDKEYVSRATIIKNADDDYEMWYSGGVGAMNHGIGYATSSDGINWTRESNNPIFHKADGVSWRAERTYCPMVIYQGGIWKMWFSGEDASSNYAIGYATSTVDLELTKEVDNTSPTVGEQVMFTITVGNTGTVETTGVEVEDFYRSGPLTYVDYSTSVGTYYPITVTWDIGDLAGGTWATLYLTATVTETGIFENFAEVIACDQDDVDSTPDTCEPGDAGTWEDDSDWTSGTGQPTAVTLSSFAARSSASSLSVSKVRLGFAGLMLATGSLFWAKWRVRGTAKGKP